MISVSDDYEYSIGKQLLIRRKLMSEKRDTFEAETRTRRQDSERGLHLNSETLTRGDMGRKRLRRTGQEVSLCFTRVTKQGYGILILLH